MKLLTLPCIFLATGLFLPHALGQPTQRVSVDSSGAQANGQSLGQSISFDGRWIVFQSLADDLVPSDTNAVWDVFLHDRLAGTTTRVSVDSSGNESNGGSGAPSISSDGGFVVFESSATNLVPGDTNGSQDIFVHDRSSGTTTRVSVDSAGSEANNRSWLGYVNDCISSDGRFVVFQSRATNLAPGDTSPTWDIFVHDRQTGATTRVSVDSSGNEADAESHAPAISGDGRYVVFESWATNLVPGDTNSTRDVFIHDRQTGSTTRASVDSNGVEANNFSYSPGVSSDGQAVVFASNASNLVPNDTNSAGDVFVHEPATGQTTRVSVDSSGVEANVGGGYPTVSADGRNVVFQSWSTSLDSSDTNATADTYHHDRQTGRTLRVSLHSSGSQPTGEGSGGSAISGNGRYVVFESQAGNLVPDDTNATWDLFVRDRIELTFNGIPAAPNTANFTVSNAIGEENKTALVLISCAGILPGFQLPVGDQRTVYLNIDSGTALGLTFASLLQGTINASGSASTPSIPFPAVSSGITVFAAAITLGSGGVVAITSPTSFVTQ